MICRNLLLATRMNKILTMTYSTLHHHVMMSSIDRTGTETAIATNRQLALHLFMTTALKQDHAMIPTNQLRTLTDPRTLTREEMTNGILRARIPTDTRRNGKMTNTDLINGKIQSLASHCVVTM